MKKGNYCRFDPKTGIKKYKTKEICDFAYWAQNEAHKVGAGPKVVKKIDHLSFQTEIADTSYFEGLVKYGRHQKLNHLYPKLHEKLKPIFKKSFRKDKASPDGVDMSRQNLGMVGNKVVMIDFS